MDTINKSNNIKIVNKSNNTIYLSDINMYISFLDGEPQYFSIDLAKKSHIFRLMVSVGQIDILECGNSLFERLLISLKEKAKAKDAVAKIDKEIKLFPPSGKIEVRIRGQFYEAGGYAKANRNLVYGLSHHGIKVSISPNSMAQNSLNELEAKKINSLRFPVSKEAICIDSLVSSFAEPENPEQYNILFTTIESETIPKQFFKAFDLYDEIWVTSDFCKKVIEKNYGYHKKVFVFPNSINTVCYKKSEPYIFCPKLDNFVFLSVFGWNYRKGTDALLRTYLEEFDSNDNVSLLLVTRPIVTSGEDIIKKEIQQAINKYKPEDTPNIVRYSGIIPEYKMPSLYSAANAFVLFTRGEGFGNIFCEASLCDCPILTTNCGGQTMFLNKTNSLLVDVDASEKLSVGSTNIHYWDGQKFPGLKSKGFIKNCRCAMREMYNNNDIYIEKNKMLKSFIVDNYNIKNVTKKAFDRIEKIWMEKK